MKTSLLVAGFSCIVVATVLYAFGYSNYNFMAGSVKVLISPAAFFALLGLVLLFWAVRNGQKSREY